MKNPKTIFSERITIMKVFNNLEEMKPYYNEETNTYEFIENGNLIDVKIDFELDINSNIRAGDIQASDIKASENIEASDIKAWNINVRNIKACDIKAIDINASEDIEPIDIKARNIRARDINAVNINAWDIKAKYIIARDISAENINANNILYDSVCYARSKFVCNSIKGTRKNSKYFCLDSEIVIKGDKKNVK